jgi:hypothetical protein
MTLSAKYFDIVSLSIQSDMVFPSCSRHRSTIVRWRQSDLAQPLRTDERVAGRH